MRHPFLTELFRCIRASLTRFLAIVAIMPALVSLMGVSSAFSHFYGGTSLLILVGVVLDTLQQIESHLLMHHYDGLTKTGRIKGRVGRM